MRKNKLCISLLQVFVQNHLAKLNFNSERKLKKFFFKNTQAIKSACKY